MNWKLWLKILNSSSSAFVVGGMVCRPVLYESPVTSMLLDYKNI